MREQTTSGAFDQVALPHLDAAYNLARWLTRRDHDAEDLVQEAYLRAFNAFENFHGGDARCWLLTIVRNTCYTWLARTRRRGGDADSFDEAIHDVPASASADPYVVLERHLDHEALRRAIEALPVEFREVLILREFEGLSYRQIADVANVAVGTVMSRLARARQRLAEAMGASAARIGGKEAASEMR